MLLSIDDSALAAPFLYALSQGGQLVANVYMLGRSIVLVRKKPLALTFFNLLVMLSATIRSVGTCYYLTVSGLSKEDCVGRLWMGALFTQLAILFAWLVQYSRIYQLYSRDRIALGFITFILIISVPSTFVHLLTNTFKLDALYRCVPVLVSFWQIMALMNDLIVVLILSIAFGFKILTGYKFSKQSVKARLESLLKADVRASFITALATIAKMIFNYFSSPFILIHFTDWLKVYACFQFTDDVVQVTQYSLPNRSPNPNFESCKVTEKVSEKGPEGASAHKASLISTVRQESFK